MRAEFDYNPDRDQLIPCSAAGVRFSVGDILQVTSKDDYDWWQARLWGQRDDEPAGIIPSPELLEWQITCNALDKAKRDKGGWYFVLFLFHI